MRPTPGGAAPLAVGRLGVFGVMVGKILLGVLLLSIAALDAWAARDLAAIRANPLAARFARLMGPSRTRWSLLCLAAFLALLGLATIIMAVAVAES